MPLRLTGKTWVGRDAFVVEDLVRTWVRPQFARVQRANVQRRTYAAEVNPVQKRYGAPVYVHQLGDSFRNGRSGAVPMPNAKPGSDTLPTFPIARDCRHLGSRGSKLRSAEPRDDLALVDDERGFLREAGGAMGAAVTELERPRALLGRKRQPHLDDLTRWNVVPARVELTS